MQANEIMNNDYKVSLKSEDKLNRYDFASDLVEHLLKSFSSGQESLVIGINGEWGAGKSSFLEFVKTEISEQTGSDERKNIIFEFNPWMFSGQLDLQKSFLTQLGIRLKTINPELKNLAEDLLLLSSLLETGNTLNPEVASKITVALIAKTAKFIVNRLLKNKTVDQLKDNINAVLKGSKIKVFIIIDDIDRLVPEEMAEIFKLVKLNANFHNTYYFLTYDKTVVSSSLGSYYKFNGQQYLEKIIQLDYSLPKPQKYDLQVMLFDELCGISNEHKLNFTKSDYSKLINAGFFDYFNNLRSIYRFVNALRLRLLSIKEEVCFVDFVAVEAIRLFNYEAYEWIHSNRESLIKENPHVLNLPEEPKQAIESLLEENEKLFTHRSKDLVFALFKTIYLNLGHFSQRDVKMDDLANEKRIAHPQYFSHYFTLLLSEDVIPERDVLLFVKSDETEMNRILEHYNDKDRLEVFLNRLFPKISKDNYYKILRNLLDFSDKNELHLHKEHKFGFDKLAIITFFLNDIGKQFGFDTILKDVLSNNQSYSRFYIQGFLKNRIDKSINVEQIKHFPEELIEENKINILQKFNESLLHFTDVYLFNPEDHNLEVVDNLFRTLHNENPEKYTEVVNHCKKSVESTLMLFHCSLSVLRGSGGEFYNISENTLMLPSLTIAEFESVLGDVDIKDYKGKNLYLLELFNKLKDNGYLSHLYYNKDFEVEEFYK